MPPNHALATPLRAWRCPQCAGRAFSTTKPSRAVGPEHPQYLPVPEPPQQTVPYLPPVKGVLPVPRDVLAGTRGGDKASKEWLDKTARAPSRKIQHPKGSRDEWKVKLSESRRRNLREGVRSVKARQQNEQEKLHIRKEAEHAKRMMALNAPEREDERLTTPTHGLDLETLLHKPPTDPNREARLATKRANVALHNAKLATERQNNLHTLYLNARTFIVTPEQLNTAVDEAFGKEEGDIMWNGLAGAQSVWAYGKPQSVQDMLQSKQKAGGQAVSTKGGLEASRERLRRIAGELMGGGVEG